MKIPVGGMNNNSGSLYVDVVSKKGILKSTSRFTQNKAGQTVREDKFIQRPGLPRLYGDQFRADKRTYNYPNGSRPHSHWWRKITDGVPGPWKGRTPDTNIPHPQAVQDALKAGKRLSKGAARRSAPLLIGGPNSKIRIKQR